MESISGNASPSPGRRGFLIALYHFHAGIIKRSAGQSVLAAAAYRAGENLFSDYYHEQADYTRKQGVVYKEILLPPHAPKEYTYRATLWNAVEKAEEHPKAQLAYSYDIALQNELSMEENIALARRFLQEQFVSRGMICDFAVHLPDPKGGIPNPHFHVLCPIRPINPDGTWGNKQRREYTLDKNGRRIRDVKGNYVWKSVPTTDWGEKETLLHWRQEWANYVNRELEKKNAPVKIDHRSYKEQGTHQLPTIHEGPTVRAMEKKGIRTEKGNLNRMIRAANALLKKLIARYQQLAAWIKEIKENLNEPVSPSLNLLLLEYLEKRNAGTYSNKAKINNL
ncbi:MAG: MobA/MobL family protein, partial [Anaerolineaceae bacterium]|nr:MobA/MobL family protein [Anaerolineaceae bacterium]